MECSALSYDALTHQALLLSSKSPEAVCKCSGQLLGSVLCVAHTALIEASNPVLEGHWRGSGVEDSPTKSSFPLQGTVELQWTLALDGYGKLGQLERLNVVIAVWFKVVGNLFHIIVVSHRPCSVSLQGLKRGVTTENIWKKIKGLKFSDQLLLLEEHSILFPI